MTTGGLTLWQLVLRTWRGILDNELLTRASSVAFYALLALVPFLALVLTLAVQLLPDLSATGPGRGIGQRTVTEFEAGLREALPPEAFAVVREEIIRIRSGPPIGLLSVCLAIAVWCASSLYLEIMSAANVIQGVKETRSLWKLRLLAIAMTLLQVIILIGVPAATVAWALLLQWLGLSRVPAVLMTVVHGLATWVLFLVSIELTLYVAPNSPRQWHWITPGSLVGSIALLLATWLFALYVRCVGGFDTTYGSLAGVVILLLWLWGSAVVLLTAAQINQVIASAGRS
jgi:membrane protein